jgi:2-keto-4-pentenoate hydratase/2-oxohepta-3-ene-1,7-dioic acid hydratase in catechol pathway
VQPGHVVTSGNYPGGSALDLGLKLDRDDEVMLVIEKLGTLTNTIG